MTESEQQNGLEVLAVTRVDEMTVIVDFSDGTSAFFSAAQLGKMAQNRMRTANWPVGRNHCRP